MAGQIIETLTVSDFDQFDIVSEARAEVREAGTGTLVSDLYADRELTVPISPAVVTTGADATLRAYVATPRLVDVAWDDNGGAAHTSTGQTLDSFSRVVSVMAAGPSAGSGGVSSFEDPFDHGAAGDGLADDRAALAAANGVTSRDKVLRAGNYRVGSNLTLTGRWHLSKGAVIVRDPGVTVTFTTAPAIGLYQVFEATPGIEFAPGSITNLLPEWWGAKADQTGTIESAPSWRACLTAKDSATFSGPISLGPVIDAAPGLYLMNDLLPASAGRQVALNIGATDNVHIRGGRTSGFRQTNTDPQACLIMITGGYKLDAVDPLAAGNWWSDVEYYPISPVAVGDTTVTFTGGSAAANAAQFAPGDLMFLACGQVNRGTRDVVAQPHTRNPDGCAILVASVSGTTVTLKRPLSKPIRAESRLVAFTGTVTAATSTTLTDVATDFIHVGGLGVVSANMTVRITGGTGAGQRRSIASASDVSLHTVTVSAAWTTTPDATSTYSIEFGVGTATSATSTTLTDSTAQFGGIGNSQWWVVITGGTGAGQTRIIASNTATQLTVTSAWTTTPDATSTYQVEAGFTWPTGTGTAEPWGAGNVTDRTVNNVSLTGLTLIGPPTSSTNLVHIQNARGVDITYCTILDFGIQAIAGRMFSVHRFEYNDVHKPLDAVHLSPNAWGPAASCSEVYCRFNRFTGEMIADCHAHEAIADLEVAHNLFAYAMTATGTNAVIQAQNRAYKHSYRFNRLVNTYGASGSANTEFFIAGASCQSGGVFSDNDIDGGAAIVGIRLAGIGWTANNNDLPAGVVISETPAGVNYTGLNRIRHPQAGNIIKQFDTTLTQSSTSMQQDPELKFRVEPYEMWEFEIEVIHDSSTVADIKMDFQSPAGSTLSYSSFALASTASGTTGNLKVAQDVLVIAGGAGAGTLVPTRIRGRIANGSTAGNLQLRAAQNTGEATNTIVKAGSTIQRTRLL